MTIFLLNFNILSSHPQEASGIGKEAHMHSLKYNHLKYFYFYQVTKNSDTAIIVYYIDITGYL